MIDSNKTLCCTINNEFRDSEEVIIQYPSCALFLWGGGELGEWVLFRLWGGGTGGMGAFFETGRSLTFPTYRVGAYKRLGT